MTRKFPLLIGALLAGAVGVASAEQSTNMAEAMPDMSKPSTSSAPDSGMSASGTSSTAAFAKLDKDQDGMISKSEAGKDTKLKGGFKTADTSKDGKLDPAEFAEFEAGASSGTMSPTPSSSTTTPGSMPPP
ncbi:MAG TPA: EF-hand domain-containing protein [Nevskiaceae bacterium]|nr:EF-hand domain-containing protein [Nevskiaceae bacterium]